WVYYRLGQLDEAVQQLERAATLLDSDPTIFDHLGDVYFTRGDLEKAEAAWRNAVSLDPTLEVVAHKLQTLHARQTPVTTP
ncbi:MAG: tetratricopeptide repeat protein, partial [Candidatus Omnitrophica bacterium]|nr:tetratricopeptide repeat protein [Candidatus Omnitrophota bacterium]